MDKLVLERVRQISADIFHVPIERIMPDVPLDSLETWDSLQHLSFIFAIEEAFSMQFEPQEIGQMLSVELVTRRLSFGKGAEPNEGSAYDMPAGVEEGP